MAEQATTVLRHLRRLAAAGRDDGASDGHLLRRFAATGDADAFALLLRRHGPMVLGVCRRILANPADADDVFQATFLVLLRRATAVRRPEALASWLYGVALRLARRARCDAIRRRDLDRQAQCRRKEDASTAVDGQDVRRVLDEELGRLPEKYRAPLVLCLLEGKTNAEAARQLGWPLGTVCGRLSRARGLLRTRLTRRGLAPAVALGASALGTPKLTAAVPPALAAVTARMAERFGSPHAALSASGRVALLADGVGPALGAGKGKAAVAVLLAAGLLAGGAGMVAHRNLGAHPPDAAHQATPPTVPQARPADAKAGRVDALGDPLPDDAVARLGTVRFRHGSAIHSMAFTPDARELLAYGNDGVRVWDPATGKQILQLVGVPDRPIGWAAFSPDGTLIATAETHRDGYSDEGPVRLWERATGKQVRQFGNRPYHQVCFSPDGKLVAADSGFRPNHVELWETATGRPVGSLDAGNDPPGFLALMPDGKTLLTAGSSFHRQPPDPAVLKAWLWDVATGSQLRQIDIGPKHPSRMTLSPDGKLLIGLCYGEKGPEDYLSVWDLTTGAVRTMAPAAKKVPPGYMYYMSGPTFSADGKVLAIGSSDEVVRLWDPVTGKELGSVPLGRFGHISSVAFSRDGKTLAVGDESIRLFDVVSGKELAPTSGHHGYVLGAVITPDGRTAATWGVGEKAVRVWDAETGREVRRLEGHEGLVQSIRLDRDGRTLISSALDKTIRYWDLGTGKELRKVTAEKDGSPEHLVAVSPDGKALAVQSNHRTLAVVDAQSGKVIGRLDPLPRYYREAAFTPGGRTLAVCGYDRSVLLWDPASGQRRELVPASQERVTGQPVRVDGPPSSYSTAVAPDGSLVAFGSRGRFLAFHDLTTGEEVRRIDDLADGVGVMAFSPDGRTLAWGGDRDPALRLIEVATGKERRCLTGHRGGVQSVAFSADGRRLITGSWDTTALVWDLSGRAGAQPAAPMTAAELDACWADLAGGDAAKAYRAIRRLANAPAESVPYLREHLKPVPPVDEAKVGRLVTDLDADDFATREAAVRGLKDLGEAAGALCRKALRGNRGAEARQRLAGIVDDLDRQRKAPSGEALRGVRAVEALEAAGTAEAVRLLEALAGGAAGTRLTDEARASARRLAARQN
jgi:RNA polymerase sigma factor (sigma-70 family)